MRKNIRTKVTFTVLILFNEPNYYNPHQVFQKPFSLSEVILQMKELSFIKEVETYTEGEDTFLKVVARKKDLEIEDIIVYKVFEYGYEKKY